jgi:hypothetical protein
MRLALHCLSLSTALFVASIASAKTELLTTRAGSVVHWNLAEITIGLDTSMQSRTVPGEGVVLAIKNAAEAWNAVPAGQPRFRFVSQAPMGVTIRFCRGKWQGDTIDLGNTQFTASTRDGTVTDASVEFNECDHAFVVAEQTGLARFDLQSVMTHELGHVLGLGHADSPAAMMFPSSRGAKVRKIHVEEQTTLALIYFGRVPELPTPLLSSIRSFPILSPSSVDSPQPQANISPANSPTKVLPSVKTDNNGSREKKDSVPADSVSVLNLTVSGGRQVMVYTCEPTLLPPITEIQPSKGPRRPPSQQTRQAPR